MKIIPKHIMIKHAGLSLVLLYLPFIIPESGILGGIGFGMTLIGFGINFPALIIMQFVPFPSHSFTQPLVMILLSELILFMIPVYIFNKLRKKLPNNDVQARPNDSPQPSKRKVFFWSVRIHAVVLLFLFACLTPMVAFHVSQSLPILWLIYRGVALASSSVIGIMYLLDYKAWNNPFIFVIFLLVNSAIWGLIGLAGYTFIQKNKN